MDERDKRQFLSSYLLSTCMTESRVWTIPMNIGGEEKKKRKEKNGFEYPLAAYGMPGFKAPVDGSCTLDRIPVRQYGDLSSHYC